MDPVTVDELTKLVPISKYSKFVTDICHRYHATEELRCRLNEKRGLANDILKELVPLSIFAEKVSEQQEDRFLQYVHGCNQSFDARILALDNSVLETLEITLACNGYQEALAVEFADQQGYAPLWTDIPHEGKRKNRVFLPEEIRGLDCDEIVSDIIKMIQSAVKEKSKSGKYLGVNLIVAFDDFRLLTKDHFRLVEDACCKIHSSFGVIYYVGLCGRFFLTHQRDKSKWGTLLNNANK